MIIKVTESTFIDAFKNMGRRDQFSREGLGLLFDYYEELGDDNMELDVIAICCDWGEYDTLAEALKDYNCETVEELEDECTVLTNDRENGPFVVQNH